MNGGRDGGAEGEGEKERLGLKKVWNRVRRKYLSKVSKCHHSHT